MKAKKEDYFSIGLPSFCKSKILNSFNKSFKTKKDEYLSESASKISEYEEQVSFLNQCLEFLGFILFKRKLFVPPFTLTQALNQDSTSYVNKQLKTKYINDLLNEYKSYTPDRVGSVPVVLYSELFYSNLGLNPEAESIFSGFLSRYGLDYSSFSLRGSFSQDIEIVDQARRQEMPTADFNKVTSAISTLILEDMENTKKPSVFLLPFDLKELRSKTHRHFKKGKTPNSNRTTLFRYKHHFVIFLPDPQTILESTVEADTLQCAAATLSNVLKFIGNTSQDDFSFLSKNVFSDCKFILPDYKDHAKYRKELIAYFKRIIEDDSIKYVALDTETKGLSPHVADADLLSIQMAISPTEAIYIPYSSIYGVSEENQKLIQYCLNKTLEKKEAIYWNMPYEGKWFLRYGISPMIQYQDAQLLYKDFNRNATAALTDATKIYCPEIAGYADLFDNEVDKSMMCEISPEDMLDYGCGDVIATYRVFYNLIQHVTDFTNMHKMHKIKKKIQYYNCLFLENVGHPVDIEFGKKLYLELDKVNKEQTKALTDDIPLDMRVELLLKGTNKNSKSNPTSTEGFKVSGSNEFGGDNYIFNIQSSNFKERLFYSKDGFDLARFLPDGVEPDLKADGALFHLKDHKYVSMYLNRQKLVKVITTYLGNIAEGNEEDELTGLLGKCIGPALYTNFNLSLTTSGRSSCNPNIQNIPNKSVASRFVRLALSVPLMSEPYVFIANDYSQIEVRVIAIISQDEGLLSIYREGRDVYAAVAAGLNSMSYEEFLALPDKERKALRQKAKAVVLGFMYGMYERGFMEYAEKTFGVIFTYEEAKEYRKRFFDLYPKLRDYHNFISIEGKKNGYAICSLGFVHTFFSATLFPHERYHPKREAALRNLVNSPCQGLAAFLTMWAAQLVMEGAVKHGITDLYYINNIHDDDTFMAPKSKQELYGGWIRWQMENLPLEEVFGIKFPIPLESSTKIGYNYAQMKELEKDEALTPIKPPWA
jgi:DNA polymerase I-like protein with 3'-5' exonuclease and polymerase domains